jgi:predicted secreted hydrolase
VRLNAIVALAFLPLTAVAVEYPDVTPGATITFPEDQGSHGQFRTEWWYVTGWLETEQRTPLGFQVTFFRTRPGIAEDNPSDFAACQILIAHAAISDPTLGRLWHDQRIARAGFGQARAESGHTEVFIDNWRLASDGAGLTAEIAASDFGFRLRLDATQAPLLQGVSGYSQKGPDPRSASFYYSLPQLAVTGTVIRRGNSSRVSGQAWLDHEWSSAYLDAEAAGWDWIGINLADGGAVMAFRIRERSGSQRWAGATYRHADGVVETFAAQAISFTPGRTWLSARTGIRYPIAWQVAFGRYALSLTPLQDDQESDSRMTTGAVYWEGAVRARGAGISGGEGYLELTGYGEPLKLP